jgi:hypothetical protein
MVESYRNRAGVSVGLSVTVCAKERLATKNRATVKTIFITAQIQSIHYKNNKNQEPKLLVNLDFIRTD